MRKQLEHLAEMAARPRVTIQVISASAGAYGGLSGAFAIGTDSAPIPSSTWKPASRAWWSGILN